MGSRREGTGKIASRWRRAPAGESRHPGREGASGASDGSLAAGAESASGCYSFRMRTCLDPVGLACRMVNR